MEIDANQGVFRGDSHALPTRVWGFIGVDIADSKQSIPTTFRKAFRDISKCHTSYKATELLNFIQIELSIVLNHRLPDAEYFHWHHFVLATEKTRKHILTEDDIYEIEDDMVTVVTGYDQLYYHYKRIQLSGCTSQVHGLCIWRRQCVSARRLPVTTNIQWRECVAL